MLVGETEVFSDRKKYQTCFALVARWRKERSALPEQTNKLGGLVKHDINIHPAVYDIFSGFTGFIHKRTHLRKSEFAHCFVTVTSEILI